MNIIRRLKLEREAERVEKVALLNGINDLLWYVSGKKFWTDNTVNCADVVLRIREAIDAAEQARVDYENVAYSNERKLEEEQRNKPRLNCEKCKVFTRDYSEIPMMGYSMILCRKCGAAAIRNGETV